VHTPPFDEAAVRAAAQQVGQAEADFAVTHAQIAAKVWPLLTPEQQAKAKEMLTKAQAHMDQMHSSMESHLEAACEKNGS
ncbi:MAG: hypothetical protein M3O15_06465, partial [Acidobacteriota bacterium]|nr:hypothetical protein [Acidobacteriota bacterium]